MGKLPEPDVFFLLSCSSCVASSLDCVSSCRSSWKVGGSAGRPYECSVLSCAWNAPRALTGALASTTQCSSCSHAEGLGGGRRRGRPRQNNNNTVRCSYYPLEILLLYSRAVHTILVFALRFRFNNLVKMEVLITSVLPHFSETTLGPRYQTHQTCLVKLIPLSLRSGPL